MSARRIREVEPSTQSSRVAATISMMVRTPRPSSPSRWRQGAVELELARGVGAVAELVLEPYDVEPVAAAVGQHPRHHEAGHRPSSACASTRNTSFIGAEVNHLWPCRVYSPSTRGRPRPGHVGADVGAALLLGHPHAGQRSALLRRPGAARGRRSSRPAAGIHSLASASSARSAGHGGVRHRDRAAVAGLGVRPGHEAGGPPDVGVRRVGLPGRGGESVADRALHQPVPRRVERRPRRSGCRSGRRPSARGGSGWRACPCSRASAVPASAPRATRSSTTSADACRVTASTRARSEVTTLWPTSGGAWLVGDPVCLAVWRPVHVDTVGAWAPRTTRARGLARCASRGGAARRRAVAPGRHHGRLLHALPRHRAGRRGGVLRDAVGAAADLRAGRRRSATSATSSPPPQVADVRQRDHRPRRRGP